MRIGSGRSGRRCGRNGLRHASTARVSSEFERADRRGTEAQSSSPYGICTRTLSSHILTHGAELRIGMLLNNITMARIAHLVTNLILSVVQYTRYSRATSGSSNMATSADADHAMSSRTLAHHKEKHTVTGTNLDGLSILSAR